MTEKWFTKEGLEKERKRIRWAKFRSERDKPGVWAVTLQVVLAAGFLAALFVGYDALAALLLKAISGL